MDSFTSPIVQAYGLPGGAVKVILDSGFSYEISLLSLLEDAVELDFAGLAAKIEAYYEPLTAELVLRSLKEWHGKLGTALRETLRLHTMQERLFDAQGSLEAASGKLWEVRDD